MAKSTTKPAKKKTAAKKLPKTIDKMIKSFSNYKDVNATAKNLVLSADNVIKQGDVLKLLYNGRIIGEILTKDVGVPGKKVRVKEIMIGANTYLYKA